MNKRLPLLVLALLTSLTIARPAPLDDLAAAIEADLDGRAVGYGYAVFQNGALVRGGGGGAAKLGDPENIFDPGVAFTEDTVKDCHSLSKTITAAALMKALRNRGISVDAPMWTFLPANLTNAIGDNNIRSITFRQLLSHRSGFAASSSFSWAQLRAQLQGGLANSIGTYEYSNWNYAVCRLLIPYILNLNLYRSVEANLANTPDAGVANLTTATADAYISYVRSAIFTPAGLGTIHPRPVDATLPGFAWYYNHSDLTIPATIMPDRRLTVGSGGWAISARDYTQFISALFRGLLLHPDDLAVMQSASLGMFSRTGSNNSDVYYTHNGATTSGGVGGRSAWMAFPGDLQVMVQVNSVENAYGGPGIGLDQIIQEAYEHAFGTPPSSLAYPRHLFFHREGDGWITSRGIGSNGGLGLRNFDYDTLADGAPAGMILHRFFGVGSQAFLLRYSPHNGAGTGNGRAVMHQVNANGTLGTEVFSSPNWLPGWTSVLTFGTPNGTFLLLHNTLNGRVRTLPISAQGNLGEAITDFDYSPGFDIAEILVIAGIPHLLRHNSTTGETHLRVLNADGSVGNTAFSGTWDEGFTDWEIFRAGGNTFIFRYSAAAGAARINRVDGSLENVPQVLDSTTWSKGWSTIRFFEIGNQAFFIRYNALTGDMRLQEITAGGVPGDLVSQSGDWLRETVGTGVFNPARSGWTGLEIYDATPGVSGPIQDLATNPDLPALETGIVIGALPRPQHTTVIDVLPGELDGRLAGGDFDVQWNGQLNQLYFIEESTDLQRWSAAGVFEGADVMLTFRSTPDPATGARPPALFYRVRSMEVIPPLEETSTAP
ncbi:MAG TPA: serine hydrolase domain-containing protein [Verrucomicrobiae bacterium]|nr:serine hydrolase domain-containing protein [Verrucomicrobiae bacterium]